MAGAASGIIEKRQEKARRIKVDGRAEAGRYVEAQREDL